MYRAKLGRVPSEIYQPEVDKFGNRVQLLDELHTAIREHQLVLYYPHFSTLVVDLLAAHNVPADAFVVEVTEFSVISDFDRSQRVIQDLCDLGIAVSNDDFGAGFTSLAYLSSLAVKELKLDRTLITGLSAADNQRGTDLVRATIDLGNALGLRIVAEGIETRPRSNSWPTSDVISARATSSASPSQPATWP